MSTGKLSITSQFPTLGVGDGQGGLVCCSPWAVTKNHSVMSDSVHHQLLELTQTQVHQVGDAIQPSHPLLSPSPPAFDLSQHQGFFQ